MGKKNSVVYECDNEECGALFLEADHVFVTHSINNGDGTPIVEEAMLCSNCLLKFLFVDRDILDPIIDLSESLQDEIAAKQEKEDKEDDIDVDSLLQNSDEEDW